MTGWSAVREPDRSSYRRVGSSNGAYLEDCVPLACLRDIADSVIDREVTLHLHRTFCIQRSVICIALQHDIG